MSLSFFTAGWGGGGGERGGYAIKTPSFEAKEGEGGGGGGVRGCSDFDHFPKQKLCRFLY